MCAQPWVTNQILCVKHRFEQYFSYIVAVSFIVGGNKVYSGNHTDHRNKYNIFCVNRKLPGCGLLGCLNNVFSLGHSVFEMHLFLL